ncbi:thiamine phosphate synthase [Croceicoccus estronivorus]|uniref:thiamine phosphate synthase n=1 Tax=Croceicoccus estronivorus TaxID=1172626 RepID=UPI00083667C9|nr:thiamine phosphate synthase [Croceicoccus estronivorus]OCC23848.1 thiamine phosphate synthase [Croceicoccus estronivorus]
MKSRQTLPHLWLLSDARNEAFLVRSLKHLPRGSGFIFRHYHLSRPERRRRFRTLSRIARRYGHTVVLAGETRLARAWRADGAYGPPKALQNASRMLHLATAHDLTEIGQANRSMANAVLLSPVFPTRSHPGARPLGPARFRLLAARSRIPVIALGGMTADRARRLAWPAWAAIDGLA